MGLDLKPGKLRDNAQDLLNRVRRLMKALASQGWFIAIHNGRKYGLHAQGITTLPLISQQVARQHLGRNFAVTWTEPTRDIHAWAAYLCKSEEEIVLREDFADPERWQRTCKELYRLPRFLSGGSLRCTGDFKKAPEKTKTYPAKLSDYVNLTALSLVLLILA